MGLGEIVGQSLTRLREKERLTQNELVMRIFFRTGETWTRAQLSTLENGKREGVSVGEMLILACAFDVTLSEMFEPEESDRVVRMGRFRMALGDLRSALAGGPIVGAADESGGPKAWTAAQVEADRAVADRLGVPVHVVVDAAVQLWGHTLTVQRDERLGDTSDIAARTLQAKRGAMTRLLTAQIEARLRVDAKLRDIRSSTQS